MTQTEINQILENQERLERKINYIGMMLVGNPRFWNEWPMGKYEGHDAPGDVFK